jgi:uncharacterized protein YbjT (DUF2867 family)
MKVILFGATGMIGQGVLRECLLDPGVTDVLSIGRRPCGVTDGKLGEIVHGELTDLSAIEEKLAGYDACFFCLGTSSAGMSEADYRRVTYDVTMAAARAIAKRSPRLTFVYVSGTGTDSTEKSRTMWARVKGATENALLAMPFKAAYMFRPAYIQPLHGIKASGRGTRLMYSVQDWPGGRSRMGNPSFDERCVVIRGGLRMPSFGSEARQAVDPPPVVVRRFRGGVLASSRATGRTA